MITPEEFASALQNEIRPLPSGFYDTFEYTKTGNNLNHPITIGTICRLLLATDPTLNLALDLRLNEAGLKFQPDVVVLSPDLEPVLFVDYESPNSSDARVPYKDVNAYAQWTADYHDPVPYFIVTSLPDKPAPSWELRHTGKTQSNAEFAGPGRNLTHKHIRANPFRFWIEYYRSKITTPLSSSLSYFNIDGKTVNIVKLD